MILLDTSALLFWTVAPDKLSATAVQAIAEADRLLINSISIWEIGIKMQKGHLTLPRTLNDFVQKLQKASGVEILPVDLPIWLESLALDWSHRDPADRVIVATAVLNTCPLITSDRIIREFYKDAVW